MDKSSISTKTPQTIFCWNGIPRPGQLVPLGMQHVVAAVVSAVGPALVVAGTSSMSPADKTLLVQMSLLMTAVSTLLQLFPIFRRVGSGLPVIMGVGFTIPTLMINQFDLPTILGAQVIAGVVAILFGIFVKPIRKLFPPLVTGTVIFTIGLSLYPVAIKYMAGGAGNPTFSSPKNWAVAIFTFLVVLICNNFSKGFAKLGSVLWGLLAGYVLSLVLGMVDFSSIGSAGWFEMAAPMHFGLRIDIAACISMSVLYVANSLQTIGDLSSITMGGMDRQPTDQELAGGIIGQGVTSIAGAFFGGLSTCSYSQNAGIVTVNKVINRAVFTFAAVVLLVAGFVPKFSAVLTTIPQCVLGGATISVFAIITMTGIRMIISAGTFTMRSSTVVGLSAALGVGITQVSGCLASFPSWVDAVFGHFAPVVAAVMAVILNLTLPEDREEA